MQQLQQQLQEWTKTMEKALYEGRVRDFTKLISVRHSLLEQIQRHPAYSRQNNDWVQTMLKQNLEWIALLRKNKGELKDKIQSTRRKRSSLGQLYKAYAGRAGNGNVIRRKG